PGFLHQSGNGQRPGVQVDAGIVIVVGVVGESLEGSQFGVSKRRRRPPALEPRARGPVAEGNPAPEQPLPERRNRKPSRQQDGTQLEELAAATLLELTAVNLRLHQNAPRGSARLALFSRRSGMVPTAAGRNALRLALFFRDF